MKNLLITAGGQLVRVGIQENDISIAFDSLAAPQEIVNPKLEWSATLLDGESVTYEEAEKAVAALGEGWRIPTLAEAESIRDLNRYDPCVDPEKYPGIKSSYHWTSTPYARLKDTAVWCVNFNFGFVSYSYRNDYACVLAVRSSQ